MIVTLTCNGHATKAGVVQTEIATFERGATAWRMLNNRPTHSPGRVTARPVGWGERVNPERAAETMWVHTADHSTVDHMPPDWDGLDTSRLVFECTRCGQNVPSGDPLILIRALDMIAAVQDRVTLNELQAVLSRANAVT